MLSRVKPINDDERKIDCATRGDRNIPLGPIYISEGKIYNPKEGRLWKLFQWNYKNDKKEENYWPGEPDNGKNYICFHDTYKFLGIPWGIAINFDENRKKWIMFEGHFCSPNCALKYLSDNLNQFPLRCRTATWMYFNQIMEIPLNKKINSAPPNKWLKRFQPKSGISIEKFRKIFLNSIIIQLPDKMVSSVTLIEEIKYKREENNFSYKRKIEKEKINKVEQARKRKRLNNNPYSKNINYVSNTAAILNIFKKNTKK